jgi:hypothetical protein
MVLNSQQKHEFWTKAFLAALTGFSARDGNTNVVVAERAEGIADEALKIYIKEVSRL